MQDTWLVNSLITRLAGGQATHRRCGFLEIIITEPLLRGAAASRPVPFSAHGPEAYVAWEGLEDREGAPGLFPVFVYRTGLAETLLLLRRRTFGAWAWFRLALEAEELALLSPPADLLVPGHLAERWKEVGVIPYPHQLETARRVINELCGRAILADEVGLGKTIEAGIIVKEYLLRRLASRILILAPATLCRQWAWELREKFDLSAVIARSDWDWERSEIVIASLDLAKSARHRERVLSRPWDLVIVDEAHKLKNNRSQNWQLVSALHSKYLLMLTATPVQNDLRELYNLINLLRPGQLGTYREFRRRYAAGPRQPRNADELRGLLQQVMIRNRRGDDTVRFTRRIIHSVPVQLTPAEEELYRAITSRLRAAGRRAREEGRPLLNLLPLVTLQREACSSSFAVILTLDRMRRSTPDPMMARDLAELLQLALAVPSNAKGDAVEAILAGIREKVIIFTEYRGTATYLARRLAAAGRSVLGFGGHLSASRKDYVRCLFQRSADVLISTESGGEGLNFQFCHHLINFDLPWNPMRIEQRIGRVHRLGQTEDVHIYNLATRGTIEERLVRLLFEKLSLFTEVMGDLVDLLGEDLAERGFQRRVMEAVLTAGDDAEEEAHLETLGRELTDRLATRGEPSRAWWDVL
ncbi:MAG: SNF2-related protein [Bacillota bacterium]|nr:SNF2-related protein [Bacillota bacterium]